MIQRTFLTALVALGTALLAAACSGQAGPQVASVGSGGAPSPTPSASLAQVYAQYAACLRQHGASEPDPTVDDQGQPHWQVPMDGIPQAQKQACVSIVQAAFQRRPPTAARLAADLKFSQCMRSHGVPTFPDPDPQNGDFPGINKNDPGIQQALPACRSLLPPSSKG
jgi:hypothetical protein